MLIGHDKHADAKANSVTTLVMKAYQAACQPPGAAVYVYRDQLRRILYFTPECSALVSEGLRQHGARPCEPPNTDWLRRLPLTHAMAA